MRKSLFINIFSSFVIITISSIIIILIFVFSSINNHYIDSLAHGLKNYAILLKNYNLFQSENITQLNEKINKLAATVDFRITIIDEKGVVLADSEENPQNMENHYYRPEIKQVRSGGYGQSLRFSETVKRNMLYVAIPSGDNNTDSPVIRVSMFVEQIYNIINDLNVKITLTVVLVIIISFFAAGISYKYISNPISLLANAAEKVADGNFDVSVLLKSNNELKFLASHFNQMVNRIKNLVNELKGQKLELTTIIDSMNDGLVVIDNKNRIQLFNEAFIKIIEKQIKQNDFYWNVLRVPEFNEMIDTVQKNRKSETREIEIKKNYYLCSVSPISKKMGNVFLFHDISKLKEIEKIKKDLSINVSHELRTPLSAIKGFIETLEEELTGDQLRYVEIIKKHTERLINIVEDLLLLSKIEYKGKVLQYDEVNISQLIETTLKIFQDRLESKQLFFKIAIPQDSFMVKADPLLLEHVFINLIDNAIKYTVKGGITVNSHDLNHEVMITVKDTGIGIPEPDIPRIFERFYVVNKSRSRHLGGTGLGLSIVKHIILQHSGRIEVVSVMEQGTSFNIFLPKK